MNFTNFKSYGNFAICLGHSTGAGHFYQPNVGELACNLFLYVYKGGGKANDRIVNLGGNDLKDFVGAPIDYEFGEDGVTWAVVNVSDGLASHCVQLVPGQHTIAGAEKKYIAVLSGQVTAKDKVIPELKFARIKEGESVSVHVPSESVAVLLTLAV
jgi:hypothetical protein